MVTVIAIIILGYEDAKPGLGKGRTHPGSLTVIPVGSGQWAVGQPARMGRHLSVDVKLVESNVIIIILIMCGVSDHARSE